MTYSNPPRRRVRHDIIVKILSTAKSGERKTRIMKKAGLSSYQLEKFLDALEKAGFITEESSVWKTTEKGLHAIEACKICLSLMKEVPL